MAYMSGSSVQDVDVDEYGQPIDVKLSASMAHKSRYDVTDEWSKIDAFIPAPNSFLEWRHLASRTIYVGFMNATDMKVYNRHGHMVSFEEAYDWRPVDQIMDIHSATLWKFPSNYTPIQKLKHK